MSWSGLSEVGGIVEADFVAGFSVTDDVRRPVARGGIEGLIYAVGQASFVESGGGVAFGIRLKRKVQLCAPFAEILR